MARIVGDSIFPANFEPRKASPFDARDIVDSKSDLTLLSTWNKGDENAYVYKGMKVSVVNDGDNNGIYFLTNTDYTNILNWVKLSTQVESTYNSFGTVTIPTITKNGDGTVTIGNNGVFNFCISANGDDLIVRKTVTGTTLTPTNNTVNYLYVDYNNGNPIYAFTLSPNVFLTEARYCPISRITREGITLHFEEYDQYGIALSNKLLYKDIAVNSAQRQTGLILSTSATRIASVTSGTLWFGVQFYNCNAITSGSVGNMFEYYLVSGVWNKSTNQNLFDSTYYSDGTNRQTMTTNRYVAKYFWRDVGDDNEIYYIHGNQYTSASGALAENVPTAPTIMTSHSIYVGKIVIQQGATLGTAYARVWEGAISTASATNHEDLSNILQAGTGVTNGHISDGTQTIYGAKTFNNSLQVNGDITFTGKMDVLFANSLSVKDTNIVCNVDGNDATSNTAGFDVYRPSGNKTIRYDNTNDRFNVNTKFNATSLLYNGIDINTDTALSNVVYVDKNNTLTNKTISLASNTITGTTAQFNTALTDGDFATLAGSETLTNKTLTSPVINETATGTGVTTTGEASKLVKTDTLGDIYERGNRVAEDFKATYNKPSIFLNGVNAYISVADNANINFGTSTFSIITEHLFESGSTVRYKLYKTASNVGFTIYHGSNNKVAVLINDGTNAWTIISTNAITDGKFHVIGFVCGVDSTSSKLYIDGIEDTTAFKTGTFPTLSKSNAWALNIGSYAGGIYHKNETRLNRLFNYALTNAKMQKYCYDGISYEDVGGNNTDLTLGNGSFATDTTDWWTKTRGTLTWNSGTQDATFTADGTSGNNYISSTNTTIVGKKYRISFRAKSSNMTSSFTYAGTNADAFTAIKSQNLTTSYQTYEYEGVASGTGFTFFIRTGTNLAAGQEVTFDDIVIQQIGCVLDLSNDSIANIGWFDKSGNNLHATYTNALPINLQNYKPRIQGYSADMRGANVASATTITPTGELFHVTGTTAIATINVPYSAFNGSITIIPDGIFTWTTAGNIALAGTAVVSKALRMTYDTTTGKWYPSYIS